jgi:tripartite-type tricarboxylate transporter receptor subunit TctC
MSRNIGFDRRLISGSLPVVFMAGFFVALFVEEGWAQQAEKYPQRPIEYIVPWGPGGGADQLARKSGKLLESILGVSVPVLNVPGATGGSGLAKLLAARADGYTMAVYIADSHALLATSAQKWRLSDLVPVARMISSPSYLFVAENSRFKSWSDFEKEAKATPGTLKVATLGYGSIDDITLTYLEGKGIKVIQVPFSNPGERYMSVLGGHADALYEQAGDVAQYIKNKQMRPIIVFAASRFPAFPDVPSSKELGYDIALPQFRTVVVKAGTDPKKVQTLSQAFKKVAESPEYKPFLQDQYAFANSFMGAEDTMSYIQAELDAMKRIFATSRK